MTIATALGALAALMLAFPMFRQAGAVTAIPAPKGSSVVMVPAFRGPLFHLRCQTRISRILQKLHPIQWRLVRQTLTILVRQQFRPTAVVATLVRLVDCQAILAVVVERLAVFTAIAI